MPSTRPSLRTVAVVLLLVVGLGGSFTFHAVAGGADITYTATAVEPGEDHATVADVAPGVADLNERLAGTAPEHSAPVGEAARTGSFAGNVSPELFIVLDDLEDTRFVVYDSRYYDWTLRLDEETTSVEIEMQPVKATTVYAETARPVESAPEEIQRAVETGTTTVTGVGVERGLYVDDGTYYVVAVENRAALVGQLFGSVVGVVLLPVGRGYVAVALGLLALRYREPSVDRPLTLRRAAGVALLSLPVALVATALFETGSLSRFVTGPASALVVATGLLAGVLALRGEWLRLAGVTVGVGLLAAGAIAAALGVVGVVFGPLAVLLGVVAGVVPFGYGYWFGQSGTASSADATESVTETGSSP
jgi:hypothetical protein